MNMMNTLKIATGLLAATVLSGCIEGVRAYNGSPDTVIATAYDKGRDKGVLEEGKAAIAYDPDGCQGWIIDDGIEGYSSPRFDPVSGLPICNNRYPPGTVIGGYQTKSATIRDWVPAARAATRAWPRAAGRQTSRRWRGTCPRPARPVSPASKSPWGWVTPCGVRARSSRTSPLRSSCLIWRCMRAPAA